MLAELEKRVGVPQQPELCLAQVFSKRRPRHSEALRDVIHVSAGRHVEQAVFVGKNEAANLFLGQAIEELDGSETEVVDGVEALARSMGENPYPPIHPNLGYEALEELLPRRNDSMCLPAAMVCNGRDEPHAFLVREGRNGPVTGASARSSHGEGETPVLEDVMNGKGVLGGRENRREVSRIRDLDLQHLVDPVAPDRHLHGREPNRKIAEWTRMLDLDRRIQKRHGPLIPGIRYQSTPAPGWLLKPRFQTTRGDPLTRPRAAETECPRWLVTCLMIPGSLLPFWDKARRHLSRQGSLASFVRLEYAKPDRGWIQSELRREIVDSRRLRLGRWLRGVSGRVGAPSRSLSHTKRTKLGTGELGRRGAPHTSIERTLSDLGNPSLSGEGAGKGRRIVLILSGLRQERHEAERSPPEDSDEASEREITEGEFHL